MRSKNDNRGEAITELRKDIPNVVYHVFGHHKDCSVDFCKVKQGLEIQNDEANITVTSEEGNGDCLADVNEEWVEGTAECDEELSRGASPLGCIDLEINLIRDVKVLLMRLANKAEKLIGNFTTNLAESWMGVRSKFDGGKVKNRCQRGSWHFRCFGAALRNNFGIDWAPKVWNLCTNVPASKPFLNHYRKQVGRAIRINRSKSKPEIKSRARKRKLDRVRVSHTKKAKESYGQDCLENEVDLSMGELAQNMLEYQRLHYNKSESQLKSLELQTREQSLCGMWRVEHTRRLTSSNFGDVLSRKVSSSVVPIVKRFIYPSFKGNMFTRSGITDEPLTVKEYMMAKQAQGIDVLVQSRGLVIDPAHQCLAASPDGLVIERNTGEKGLLEVKNLLQNKAVTLEEAATNMKSFCLALNGTNLHLKRNHKYFHQCQGLVNIVNMPWIDFVVRHAAPHQLHIERIYKDEVLWKETMQPKLLAFFNKAMLPELACPRMGKHPGIRIPSDPWVTRM